MSQEQKETEEKPGNEATATTENSEETEPVVSDLKQEEAESGAEDRLDPEEMSLDGLNQEIESLRLQVAEYLEKALRAQAEMENLRKRTTRDIENAHKYALDKFIREILPIIDSMELGISATASADDIESIKEGMDLTLKKLHDTLEKFGVLVITPEGEKFDPEKHEAVSVQEIEGTESGFVISVLQKGYELNGRLVRPAMVVVAK